MEQHAGIGRQLYGYARAIRIMRASSRLALSQLRAHPHEDLS
jgi:hypothetical protein